MRRFFLLLATVCALVAVGSAWWLRSHTSPPAAADDPKLFANRVWAERAPRDDRDLVLYFVPLQLGSKQSGVIQRSSKYAYGGEVFGWKRDGNTLSLDMPQRERVLRVPVRTWACKGEAPKGFDLCLELGTDDDKLRLYSRKGWRVPKGEDLPELAAAIAWEALPNVDGACEGCAEVGVAELLGGAR